MKGLEYYAERLLAQAIADPRVNALDGEEVRTYIKEEAKKLCIPPEETADYAMRGHNALTTDDFKKGTAYSTATIAATNDSTESKDISKSPPF